VEPVERVEHFLVMLGQLLDGALIGRVFVRLVLSGRRVVEGSPSNRPPMPPEMTTSSTTLA
jgi:hypothetical protein